MTTDDLAYGLDGRHPATLHLLHYFTFEHLRGDMRDRSHDCADLAYAMARLLPDGPELSAGLRHLLEAKDCFVRAALDQSGMP